MAVPLCTVSAIVVEWMRLPLAPCTETEELPTAAEAAAPIKTVVLPPLGTVNGLCGFAVTPAGMPLRVICTSPEKPLSACTLTAIPELVELWLMVVEDGDRLIEKSGSGGGGDLISAAGPPPQPACKTPAKIAHQPGAMSQSLLFVMQSFAANAGGRAPKLEAPAAVREKTAQTGRESILRQMAHSITKFYGLVKLGNKKRRSFRFS